MEDYKKDVPYIVYEGGSVDEQTKQELMKLIEKM